MEAAINAARQANVRAGEVAKILVDHRNAGENRTPSKDLVEAFHSLPYYLAGDAADKDFTWIHASPAKFHDPAITRLMGLVDAEPSAPPVKYQ